MGGSPPVMSVGRQKHRQSIKRPGNGQTKTGINGHRHSRDGPWGRSPRSPKPKDRKNQRVWGTVVSAKNPTRLRANYINRSNDLLKDAGSLTGPMPRGRLP